MGCGHMRHRFALSLPKSSSGFGDFFEVLGVVASGVATFLNARNGVRSTGSVSSRSRPNPTTSDSNQTECSALRQQRDEAQRAYNRLIRASARGEAESYFLPVVSNAQAAMNALGC